MAMPWPSIIAPAPTPALPVAMPAPMPAIIARMFSIVALFSSSWIRTRCPPAMWPVSWAITPITWFGESARINRPVLMNMFIPGVTKALIRLSLTRCTLIAAASSPAALKTGSA